MDIKRLFLVGVKCEVTCILQSGADLSSTYCHRRLVLTNSLRGDSRQFVLDLPCVCHSSKGRYRASPI